MPLLTFNPLLKRIRWGGRRLGTVLGKDLGPHDDYAESWEVVDHGDDQSVVKNGEYADWTLQRLVQERPQDLLGRPVASQFPLLIKFLDANDRLSVQVHPDDALAKLYDPAENGKTEAWVVVDADPGSRIFAGLRPGVTATDVRDAIASGSLVNCLHDVEVSPGDCYFIPAGTVHAIGEGTLIAEVQQSSDITFRLYDWDRLDPSGKPRELHIEQALRCTDFERGPVSATDQDSIEAYGQSAVQLAECAFFRIRRFDGTDSFEIPADGQCRILMVLDGEGVLTESTDSISVGKGASILATASCDAVNVAPSPDSGLRFLEVTIP